MTEEIRFLRVGLDQVVLEPLFDRTGNAGCCDAAATATECLHLLSARAYDVLLTGTDLPDMPVERFLEESLRRLPRLVVVVLSSDPDYGEAVRLTRFGATAYLPLESNQARVSERLQERIWAAYRDKQLAAIPSADRNGPLSELVGGSKAIRDVIQLVRLIAPRQSTVLISGRTGTGKELVARAIHAGSPRADQPIVTVNCGAVPASLMEAEFFGHVKGAFTGAVGNRAGRFEQAHRGTIVLDEIGEMPPEMQSKLLRALQEREFQRVGSSETLKVDVRVIAATNCDLKALVQQGRFREDLYYRLNVVPISLPSLAERIEDIPLLVDHLLRKICQRENLLLKQASPEALARLTEYGWPGNVRQLENAIEKAVALSGGRQVLYPSDFPLPPSPLGPVPHLVLQVRLPAEGLDFDSVVSRIQRSLLEQALQRSGGNKKRAAELLRIKRTTFAAKWRSLQGVDKPG